MFVFLILLLIPVGVFAATTPLVKILEATSSGSTITYKGTMEGESHAVMCKLYNSSDEEIDLLSLAVDNSNFEGKFENVPKGTYTIACANYEGGDIKKVSVEVDKVNEKNPKTSDEIIKYVSLLMISMFSLIVCFKLSKKH